MQRRKPKYVAAELHQGGLDERGRRRDNKPPITLPRILPWDRDTTEPRTGSGPSHDRASALIEWGYLPKGVVIGQTDRLLIPEGRLQGWWHVDGKPQEWPRGLQVPLTRGRTGEGR
ncbi:hypothetical protein [Nesterenkonia rhizosphaerae]|uniref:Uncharacterized protein n=1 Tax=Nesterenkonia rhizosphaerae TaxID=1348272 RepID=A0ABP9G065_9MICC